MMVGPEGDLSSLADDGSSGEEAPFSSALASTPLPLRSSRVGVSSSVVVPKALTAVAYSVSLEVVVAGGGGVATPFCSTGGVTTLEASPAPPSPVDNGSDIVSAMRVI